MPRHRDLDANGSGSYRIPHAPRHRGADVVTYDSSTNDIARADRRTYLERLRDADAVIHPNDDPVTLYPGHPYPDFARAIADSLAADRVADRVARQHADTPIVGVTRAICGPGES